MPHNSSSGPVTDPVITATCLPCSPAVARFSASSQETGLSAPPSAHQRRTQPVRIVEPLDGGLPARAQAAAVDGMLRVALHLVNAALAHARLDAAPGRAFAAGASRTTARARAPSPRAARRRGPAHRARSSSSPPARRRCRCRGSSESRAVSVFVSSVTRVAIDGARCAGDGTPRSGPCSACGPAAPRPWFRPGHGIPGTACRARCADEWLKKT